MSASGRVIDSGSAFQILENLPSAILVVDEKGFIIYSNKRVGEILHLDEKSLDCKPLGSVLIPFSQIKEIANNDSLEGGTNRCLVKIGKNREMTIGFSLSEVNIAVKDINIVEKEDCNCVGKAENGYIISFQNIEKIKDLEDERNQLLQHTAIQNTLHSILHEVKNPIAAITAIVELAIEDLDGVSIQSRLGWVISLCNNLYTHWDKLSRGIGNLDIDSTDFTLRQVEQLKSKLEALLTEYKKTDLERELNSIFSECKRVNLILEGISCIGDHLISEKYISIDQSIKEALLILNAKAVQSQVTLVDNIEPMPLLPFNNSVIRSIIFNLVINAIKFSPPGSRVEVTSRLEIKNKKFLLRVKDFGIGMSEDVKKRAMDLFFTTHEKGSGIGLALVYEFVLDAGGNIEINSAPGQGTQVDISIPNIKIDRTQV